jgi:hypothetical protein
VRNSLTDRYELSRKDLLHFIPFVVHAIGLIPYLFSPFSEKIDFIKKLYASPELIINAQVNTFFDTNENFIIRLSLLSHIRHSKYFFNTPLFKKEIKQCHFFRKETTHTEVALLIEWFCISLSVLLWALYRETKPIPRKCF